MSDNTAPTDWRLVRVVRRWLNRNKPFVCKRCGFSVPLIGNRQDQAALAIDHMEDEHHDYYFYGAPNEIGNDHV